MPTAGDTIVVAGVSARALAESARQAGWRVIALDLFGDADARRASDRWIRIGDPATLSIDAVRLRSALAEAAAAPGVVGWVAGGGFEGAPALLAAAPAGLPLLGMSQQSVAALRDARHFFATLDRCRLPHPVTRFEPPADPNGWLVKRAGGTGGWHITLATQSPAAAASDAYYQRQRAGTPMSALFLADGERASLVALNRLLVRPLGGRPFVYRGAIGPIVDAALQARVERALEVLVPALALRGLASLDFISAEGEAWILEINPRPSASMVLHADAWPQGLLHAHVQAVAGRLPPPRQPTRGVRGCEILFAHSRCCVEAALAERMAALHYCHDLPTAGACFAAGEPVCSLSAEGADPAAVERMLAYRLARIAAQLHDRSEVH